MSDPAEFTPGDVPGQSEHRVSTLELFFDLVFVFAFTQVTLSLADDTTWAGLGRGAVVFLLLWWAWGAYAWLTTVMQTMRRGPRVVVLMSMAAMLVTALAVPTAYDEGGLAFALGWLVVMLLHATLFRLATDPGATSSAAIVSLGSGNALAGVVLVVASFTDGPTTTLLFLGAVAVAYSTPYIWGVTGFSINPGHFAERHGLIMIVALGESIVAIGAGGGELSFDAGTVAAALLAMALVSALWWAYFDSASEAVEASMSVAAGPERSRLARDVYSYLHIPLVFGIVMAALGLKKTLGHVDEPLGLVSAAAFCGGVAGYLVALHLIHMRCRLRGDWWRVLCAAFALAIIAVAVRADALVALAVLAAVAAAAAVVPRSNSRAAGPIT